ncbi:MAG TPA: hypothetical protein VG965_05300 [Patescibacteria group bacterium]|nr:hypothetical protein [Patescibacteria group bacterium]
MMVIPPDIGGGENPNTSLTGAGVAIGCDELVITDGGGMYE